MTEECKEVRFDWYCKSCKHKDVKDSDDPCNECLDNPVNLHSHKPTKYEEETKNSKE